MEPAAFSFLLPDCWSLVKIDKFPGEPSDRGKPHETSTARPGCMQQANE